MKTRKGPKSQLSADGINVREGETYYIISYGYGGYAIAERKLRKMGIVSSYSTDDFKRTEIDDQGVYFCREAKDCFYERENAVAEIIKRLKDKAERLLAEVAKWEAERATTDAKESE